MNNKKKTVILEGCLGDWASRMYFPTLKKFYTQSLINLIGIDYNKESADTTVPYIDKLHDLKKYEAVGKPDIVFIVSKPDSHNEIIRHWLSREERPELILVEKPFDIEYQRALQTNQIMKSTPNIDLFLIDHYFLKFKSVHSSVHNLPIYEISSIQCNIIEPSIITHYSYNNLMYGVISDLLSHALLPIAHILCRNERDPVHTFLSKLTIQNSSISNYANSIISNETYAKLQLTFNSISITLHLGKGIGKKDNKRIIVKSLDNSKWILDFKKNNLLLNSFQSQYKYVEPFPVPVLLNDIIKKPKVEYIDKLVTIQNAIEFIKLTETIKKHSKKLANYQIGSFYSYIR